MSRIKIKQLDERVATSGLHMGGGPERRKLEPGEVIDIPDDLRIPDGRSLLDVLWKTGKVDLTRDPVTRPLDYANYREGLLCSPNFKPRDNSEENEMLQVRAKVEAGLNELESDAPEEYDPVSPADDVLDSNFARTQRKKGTRKRRQAALKAAGYGEKVPS